MDEEQSDHSEAYLLLCISCPWHTKAVEVLVFRLVNSKSIQIHLRHPLMRLPSGLDSPFLLESGLLRGVSFTFGQSPLVSTPRTHKQFEVSHE